ncbi:MAG TPA: UbiX family flavin prenyltransferase [Conexibacter sp.]|nr:UbiX family flavin prenyltransferase [Conexibacter sp.]
MLGGPSRLVVGISGATGVAYGVRALQLARAAGVETHLVMTQAAALTATQESDLQARDIARLADVSHRVANVGASIASGSFPTDGMLIAPCSSRTLAAIAHGLSDNLLTRAAEVTLKERRPLVVLFRETPYTLAHLRAMEAVTEMGGIVMPPVPALYLRPGSVEEVVDFTVSRALDLLGVSISEMPRWNGLAPRRAPVGPRPRDAP